MSRAWVALATLVAIAAIAAGLAPRRPHEAANVPAPRATRPAATLMVTIRDGVITPDAVAAPVGAHVTVVAQNAESRALTLSLMGYEDQVKLALDAGTTGQVAFDADRPGEDFAWIVDGRPVGRVRIVGSHLVEGHR